MIEDSECYICQDKIDSRNPTHSVVNLNCNPGKKGHSYHLKCIINYVSVSEN